MSGVCGITIAVPTYNRAHFLKFSLLSLQRLVRPAGIDIEIVIIDNDSTDNTAEVVAAAAEISEIPVRYVRELNQGLCFCRNTALRIALHDDVVYFDDDVEVNPQWLIGYVEAVEAFGADCVVGPVYAHFLDPPPQNLSPRILRSLSSVYSLKGEQPRVLSSEEAHEVPGCNFGVRKRAALEVGGFDVNLDRKGKGLLAGGDFEFGRRLVLNGKRVCYHPFCSIKHIITSEKLSKGYLRRRWYGMGVTRRLLDEKYGKNLRFSKRFRLLLGACRLSLRAYLSKFFAPPPVAFEHELDSLAAWGYLFPERQGA